MERILTIVLLAHIVDKNANEKKLKVSVAQTSVDNVIFCAG